MSDGLRGSLVKTVSLSSWLMYSTEFLDTSPKSPDSPAVCQKPPVTHGSLASPAHASFRNRSGLVSSCDSSARKYSHCSNGSPMDNRYREKYIASPENPA